MAAGFTDHRDRRLVEHSVRTLVAHRITGIALGYEDLSDHDDLRRDPVLALLSGKLESFVNFWKGLPPSRLGLDIDSTDDAVHGRQEGRFYHGYYNHYCFLPLYIACGGRPLFALLRPGNADPAGGVTGPLGRIFSAFASILFDALRQALHGTRLARATAGTLRLKLLRIGARVTVSARRMKVAMDSAHPSAAAFARVHARLPG